MKKKLKILCVIPGKPDNNSMVFALNECKRLQKFGLESKVFYLDFSIGIYTILYQILCLKKITREYRPHIVHSHYGSLNAFICALIKTVPLVITYRGSDLNSSQSDGFVRDKLQKVFSQFAALKADAIICVSKELKQRLWWNTNRAKVITTGVDTDLFTPINKNVARTKLGLSRYDKIVLFVGGQVPKVKRIDLAKESISQAASLSGHINFIILYGDITFTEMPYYYNAADCFLFTSDYEGSPCAIQEAIACGVPIISVDVGDVRERLEGVTHCRIVDRNPTIIGKAITNVLTNSKRTNGPELIKNLTVENTTQQIVQMYESCI
jgi:teichuronic acid biosynthesis glycosyltransferase TuaC